LVPKSQIHPDPKNQLDFFLETGSKLGEKLLNLIKNPEKSRKIQKNVILDELFVHFQIFFIRFGEK
jgi:hypothetical protein